MPSNEKRMSGPLALVVRTERTYPGGDYDVCDSRSGEALATRGDLSSANEVAVFLNSTYPVAAEAPAHDTLVHEIVGYRISGEPAQSLYLLIEVGRLQSSCPAYIPTGPGWDHLYEEAGR